MNLEKKGYGGDRKPSLRCARGIAAPSERQSLKLELRRELADREAHKLEA